MRIWPSSDVWCPSCPSFVPGDFGQDFCQAQNRMMYERNGCPSHPAWPTCEVEGCHQKTVRTGTLCEGHLLSRDSLDYRARVRVPGVDE